jgi:FkbM family methyltransferase
MKPGVLATQHARHLNSESCGHRRMMDNHRRVFAGFERKKSVIERHVAELIQRVPVRIRTRIIGPPNRPSWIANAIHSLLNWLPSDPMPVLSCRGPLAGFRMRTDWRRYRAFAYGTWEPNVVQALSRLVRPGWGVVDIGAHIGFYALLFSRLVGPKGTVFAFEPLPGNFDVLLENLALNQCGQVRAVNKAVMDHARQIILHVPSADLLPGDSSARHSDGTIPLQVEAIQLDEFLSDQGLPVHLIKIDVEGAEENVLLGAREAIREYHPVLVVELHHFDGDLSKHAVPRILGSWGYEVRYLDRWEFTSHILAVWKGNRGVENGSHR